MSDDGPGILLYDGPGIDIDGPGVLLYDGPGIDIDGPGVLLYDGPGIDIDGPGVPSPGPVSGASMPRHPSPVTQYLLRHAEILLRHAEPVEACDCTIYHFMMVLLVPRRTYVCCTS